MLAAKAALEFSPDNGVPVTQATSGGK
jgi:hypothetical protein